MKNKEAILSKAVIATLGYEMLQREFIEVLVIYLMNKHNLRSHNKDQLEAELDRNFNLMNAVGSKRNRNESKPECRTWQPPSKKEGPRFYKEKMERYYAFYDKLKNIPDDTIV